MTYETTIGLEAHVQLATASKAFCGDRNEFGAEPNRHISEISLGYPGTLPFLNEKQVELAVRLGLALGCEINLRSTFDRKNYFYADLPKGYQITQEKNPICLRGRLPIRTENFAPARRRQTSPELDSGASPWRNVQLHHIHMEEDAGKSVHAAGENFSRVDLNRAGTPLLEIVTEPDLHGPEEVDAFMNGMRQLVRWLDVSDGNMQEGSLRCDVNISVRPEGQTEFGTRCEIKNMNSMRFARRAITYEVQRQIGLLEDGQTVTQQTRQFNPDTGKTSALRNKENAHDYRYFPDPDLPPVVLAADYVAEVKAGLGILPWEAFEQLVNDFDLTPEDAGLISEEREAYFLFLTYAEATPHTSELSKLWINKLLPALGESGTLTATPVAVAELLELVQRGTISAANAAARVLPQLLKQQGESAEKIAKTLGLVQNADAGFLEGLVAAVIAENPDKVKAYRGGKKGLIGFFMGEVMKKSKGSAEPRDTRELLEAALRA